MMVDWKVVRCAVVSLLLPMGATLACHDTSDRDEAISDVEATRPVETCSGAKECFELGWEYSSESGGTANQKASADYYEQACEYGHMLACFNLAWALEEGEGVQVDDRRAEDLYRSVCDSDAELAAAACGNLGSLYIRIGDPRANKAFLDACEKGKASGCTLLGMMYRDGRHIERDVKRAREYFLLGCNSSDGPGCFELALLLDDGQGVREDNTAAAEYYQDACDYGHSPACTNAGVMFETGEGVERDSRKALQLYETACKAGDRHGCLNLARLHGTH